MAQAPYDIKVTIATAGTRQRVITDPNSPYRICKSAVFHAATGNTDNVYIGGAAVTSDLFSARLDAGEKIAWEGDQVHPNPGDDNNMLDLYNTWVDCDTNGAVVYVGINVRA